MATEINAVITSKRNYIDFNDANSYIIFNKPLLHRINVRDCSDLQSSADVIIGFIFRSSANNRKLEE